MTKTQKVITIETHRQVRIYSRRASFVAWCEDCGAAALMLVPAQAAAICGASERRIFRLVERGELHFIETSQGTLFVCGNSLELY